MAWRILADVVVVLHLTVVGFIVFGGFLAWRWPRLALVHLPFATWGVAIEVGRWTCPLTPLENHLRRLGGEAGYGGGFVERYLVRALYPEGLGAGSALALAAVVLFVNAAAYAPLFMRRGPRRPPASPPPPAAGPTPGRRAPVMPPPPPRSR